MPHYLVKISRPDGWLRLPVVANFPNEAEAAEAVRLMVDEDDKVEIKGVRNETIRNAFGDVPEGSAVFRRDWTWRGENDDTLEPY